MLKNGNLQFNLSTIPINLSCKAISSVVLSQSIFFSASSLKKVHFLVGFCDFPLSLYSHRQLLVRDSNALKRTTKTCVIERTRVEVEFEKNLIQKFLLTKKLEHFEILGKRIFFIFFAEIFLSKGFLSSASRGQSFSKSHLEPSV